MKDIPYKRLALPSKFLPESSWALTAAGVLFGLLPVWMPSLAAVSIERRITLAAFCFCTPFLLRPLLAAARTVGVLFQRAVAYPYLFEQTENLQAEKQNLQAAIAELTRDRDDRRSLAIEACYVFGDKLTIRLRRKRGFSVHEGDRCVVIDKEEGMLMGRLVVVACPAGEGYHATVDGSIDPVWEGLIRRNGAAETKVSATMVAVFLHKDGESDDEIR